MKKILSMLLAVLMILSLCACGKGDSSDSNSSGDTGSNSLAGGGFQVGYGKGDITPEELGVPMNGYSKSTERLSTGLLSYIYAITLAVRDNEGNTALMMSVDTASIGAIGEEVRQWASATYNIPAENILVSAIHQHSCPDPYVTDWPTSVRYRERIVKGMQDSVKKALEDLAPAEMYINTATTDALSFVRHYIAKDPAGSIVGDNYNDTIGSQYGYKGHESESDKEMRMVKFTREGDKKDIIVVNFQAHPHMGTSAASTDIHSDWPGVMRDEVSKALNCETMYFSGAGGNLNSTSRITSENVSADYKEHGKRAAQYVIDAESSYTKVSTGTIKAKSVTVQCEADHSMDHLYNMAKEVDDARSISTAKAVETLAKYSKYLHSIYHATAVVSKFTAGDYVNMTIGAIAIGDVVFTYHPYEMFDENGMELRVGSVNHENSKNYDADDLLDNPYKMTMITTMSNGAICYVPSRRGYTNGGYSTDITKVAPGTGEQLVGDYLRILNELYG